MFPTEFREIRIEKGQEVERVRRRKGISRRMWFAIQIFLLKYSP